MALKLPFASSFALQNNNNNDHHHQEALCHRLQIIYTRIDPKLIPAILLHICRPHSICVIGFWPPGSPGSACTHLGAQAVCWPVQRMLATRRHLRGAASSLPQPAWPCSLFCRPYSCCCCSFRWRPVATCRHPEGPLCVCCRPKRTSIKHGHVNELQLIMSSSLARQPGRRWRQSSSGAPTGIGGQLEAPRWHSQGHRQELWWPAIILICFWNKLKKPHHEQQQEQQPPAAELAAQLEPF